MVMKILNKIKQIFNFYYIIWANLTLFCFLKEALVKVGFFIYYVDRDIFCMKQNNEDRFSKVELKIINFFVKNELKELHYEM